MQRRFKIADLFCCQGGSGKGLHDAGFEVVGFDIVEQPRYPFEFRKQDALTVDLSEFDAVWASPPCQYGSIVTATAHRSKHENLIPQTRAKLVASGLPFIIENVENNRRDLCQPIMLCGSMFALQTFRHRYFETQPLLTVLTPPCRHDFKPLLVTTAGCNSRAIRPAGEWKSVKNAPAAYGIDWMTHAGLKQAIPPVFAEFLGRHLIAVLERANEVAA